MSKVRYLKIKLEDFNLNKTILIPSSFSELLEKINLIKPNNDPNKLYQIYDVKLGKIINNQSDYQLFNSQHLSENKITLIIKLIEKNNINIIPDYQPESSSLFFESCIIPKQEEKEKEKEKEEEKNEEKEKELTEEEKIKESIRLLVQSQLKIFENNILNEINNNSQPIHKGIKCNKCGMKDIKGIRYKCSTCLNYNLCEKCEDISAHDENHVFVKIKEPIFEENKLNEKINSSMLKFSKNFDNNNNDYITEPNVFHFRKNNLINVQRITLKNNGNIVWKKGFIFKCIKEKSNLILNDVIFEVDVNPKDSINLELLYEKEIDFDKKEFYSSYILIDDKNNQIGSIHEFIIKIS